MIITLNRAPAVGNTTVARCAAETHNYQGDTEANVLFPSRHSGRAGSNLIAALRHGRTHSSTLQKMRGLLSSRLYSACLQQAPNKKHPCMIASARWHYIEASTSQVWYKMFSIHQALSIHQAFSIHEEIAVPCSACVLNTSTLKFRQLDCG